MEGSGPLPENIGKAEAPLAPLFHHPCIAGPNFILFLKDDIMETYGLLF